MTVCCVSGCRNRYSSSKKIKFYRIPSGYRPFQANRRRLWLQAIQQVNGGSTEEIKDYSRVCSAHFISGEMSMDHDNPDFVPSVFSCIKQRKNSKRKAKWSRGRRKRQGHTANAEEQEEETATPRAESPMDLQSSVLMEEIQTPPSPKEGETLNEEAENETDITSQTTSSSNTASPSFKVLTAYPELDRRVPVVLLKSVFAAAGEYQCELCNQNFASASQLVKHKQQHEEQKSFICELCRKLFTSQADLSKHQCVQEPSFQCNMCDRSFSSSHNLKRHKLLHVKDGRKCRMCGVLFCRRHNHILFVPQNEYEQDSYINEPQDSESDLTAENSLLEKSELNQTADLDDDAQITMTTTSLSTTTEQTVSPNHTKPQPLSKICAAPPPASCTRILTEIPVPVMKPFSVPQPRPPGPKCSKFDYPTTFVQPHLPQHPELPSSLQIFSPQCLTSALLDVQRNYEYILSKPCFEKRSVLKKEDIVKKVEIVKEEECELLLTPPVEQRVKQNKKERTAYDLEIVL